MFEREIFGLLERYFVAYLFLHSDSMSYDSFRHCTNCLKYIENCIDAHLSCDDEDVEC